MTETERRTSEIDAPRAAVATLLVITGIDGTLNACVAEAISALGHPATATASDAFAAVNDHLLERLGTSLSDDVERLDELDELALRELRDQAHAALDTATLAGPTVICGAAYATLLPFWLALRPIAVTTVLCVPTLRAYDRSQATDGPDRVRTLAAFERYHRVALEHLEHTATFICTEAQLDKEPAAALGELCSFIGAQATPPEAVLDRALACLRPRADAKDAETSDEAQILGPLLEFDGRLAGLAGAHPALAPGLLGDESPWAAAVRGLERDLSHLTNALLWTSHQIEPVLRADVPETDETPDPHERPEEPPDSANQFEEPAAGGPYPLSASEDRRGYHRWLIANRDSVAVGGPSDQPRRKARTRAPRRPGNVPLISVLVPVWKTPLWALERCVGSVLNQTFANWELCLCDDASNDRDLSGYLRGIRRLDRRIRVCALEHNGGISAATNAALAVARGRYVTFLDHDDELSEDALESVADAIASSPNAEFLYSDEDKIDAAGERFDPLFKPEWSPDLLMSFAYICHLTVVRRDLVVELGGLRSEFDGSQDYDLSLRATERATEIVHIPKILYHWRTLPGSAATDSAGAVAKPWAYEAGRRALEDALERRGERGEVTLVGNYPGRYAVRRRHDARPLVSIIVPFRDEPGLLATCAATLRENPGYDRIELVLVDNGSQLPETMALLDRLGEDDDVRIISSPGPFNWAAINNAAVREASGEVLLFANNDIEARVPRWLDAMLSHALRPEVGAVGARLLYPDGAIQHAGVVIGLGGIAGHVLRGLPGDQPGYNSTAIATRNCSVVTGACMMVRREVFDAVGGFDELLPVAFNDVDFCLKVREQGYLIVYTPEAELVHHESRSRGHTDDLSESRRIVRRWKDAIAAGDPYMNVHLSHWRYWCPLSTAQEDDRWKTYLETSVLTRASSSTT